MTEICDLQSVSATPLGQLLESTLALPLAVYRGSLTAPELDAPEKETAALVSGCAVHDLGWMRRFAVRGEDRFRWLSGMITNTVSDLAANAGAWNLVLNAQGRIQGELHVWREGEDLYLEIAADQQQRLRAHLERFIIMDDVELVPLNSVQGDVHSTAAALAPQGAVGRTAGAALALGLTGPESAGLLARLGLPAPTELLTSLHASWNGTEVRVARAYGAIVPHYELWFQPAELSALWGALIEAGATPVGFKSLDALRIAEAVPTYGIDMIERDLPQETAQMRTLSFTKGCYQGQEIVERIRSRGSVHRHLRQLEIDGPLPAPGTEVTFQNASGAIAVAGAITSAAGLPLLSGERRFALAMIRDEAELRALPLAYSTGGEAGSARILAVPPILDREPLDSNSGQSSGASKPTIQTGI